jgi:hypothetical protein
LCWLASGAGLFEIHDAGLEVIFSPDRSIPPVFLKNL